MMLKQFFTYLNRLNKIILPKYYKKDPSKLTKLEQAITAYRYFVLLKSLD